MWAGFKNMLTEPDNKTFCPVRIVALAGSLQFLTLVGFHYFREHTFDCQQFAIGFGALIGGVGAALGFKKDTPGQ